MATTSPASALRERTYSSKNGLSDRACSQTDVVPVEVRQRIDEMVRPDGWDLDDSKAVTRATCDAATNFMADVFRRHPSAPEPEFISPIADGSIALQWREKGASLVVLIDRDSPSYYRQFLDKQGSYIFGTISREAILSEFADALL